MSEPATHIPACFTRPAGPATAAGAPTRQRRVPTIARGVGVLTAATAMTIATLALAAPAGAAPRPPAAAVTSFSALASPGTGSAALSASHQKGQPSTQAPAVGALGWSPTGSMITPRVWGGEASTLLADGQVLVTGGYDGYSGLPQTQPLSSSELYNPATGTWSATGSLLRPLAGATAITLANGNVLLVGGGTAETQLYNPTTGTWKAGASMPSPLVGLVAENDNLIWPQRDALNWPHPRC